LTNAAKGLKELDLVRAMLRITSQLEIC
jgi:hypothetical protein